MNWDALLFAWTLKVFCLFKLLCTRCRNNFFPPYPRLKPHLYSEWRQAIGQGDLDVPRKKKFNICHHIKWLCSPANEKPQTFENCLATLPAHKKLSVTSFFRRICLSVPPSLPSLYPFSFSALFLLFLALTLALFSIHMYSRICSPFLATERELICFIERNGWYSASSQILNRAPGCVGCRLVDGRAVWIRETCVAFSCK